MRFGENNLQQRTFAGIERGIMEVHIHPKYLRGTIHYNVGIAVAGVIFI
jgi:hypothetical protein